MTRYDLADNLYVLPTPSGAFYAVSSADRNPIRRLIRHLLAEPSTPRLTLEGLQCWSGLADGEQALDLLYRAQEMRWLQGVPIERDCPAGAPEDLLPGMLPALGSQGRVLLADSQGVCRGFAGFTPDVAAELSTLGADLLALNVRRSELLQDRMGLNSGAWGVVDAGGGSRLGFWPLYMNDEQFVLGISGLPRFNQPAFVTLAWLLGVHFGTERNPDAEAVASSPAPEVRAEPTAESTSGISGRSDDSVSTSDDASS